MASPNLRPQITLGDKVVGAGNRPYIIAEIGVNHEGSLETAKSLIEMARAGGADAAKFQTYKASTLAARKSPAYWDLGEEPTKSQFELFKKHDGFGEPEYLALTEHCRRLEIDFLSTPFDAGAVDFLAPLMPFFKIASADLTNVPLLRQVAAKNKPVALSTGAANVDEIGAAVRELEDHGAGDIALLHCVLNYPCEYENAHLNMIEDLIEKFPGHVIGYSDHTRPDPGMAVLTAAYLKGARIIEKHFTHDKTLPGNDHYHAMDESDLRTFASNLSMIEAAAGQSVKHPLDSEGIARLNARRSIVTRRPIRAGESISEDMIIPKRPATGISPVHWDEIIGSRVEHDLAEDHILTWDDLENRG